MTCHKFLSKIAMLAVFTLSFAASSFQTDKARLNFVVDNDLRILSASNEHMSFHKPLNEIVGQHIVHLLPLSSEKAQSIERAFSAARQVKETTQINYEFDPFAGNPNMGVAYPTTQYYRAEITPLYNAKGAASGFFVKVVQQPSFHHNGPTLE